MKKIFIILLLLAASTKNVLAINNQKIDRIEYKWYKEEKIEGKFYPKKDNLSGYIEDKDNIEYSEYTDWNQKYCSYSEKYYLLEEKNIIKYEKILKTRYIMLCSIHGIGTHLDFKVVTVYYDNEQVKYKIIDRDEYDIKLDLEQEYDTAKLEIYVETFNVSYIIKFANDIDFNKQTISYSVNPKYDPKKLVWNEDWITENSTFEEQISELPIQKNKDIRNIRNEKICRTREINTYRYKLEKVYYDNNYHVFVDGYTPDIATRIIYYANEEENISQNEENIKNNLNEKIEEIQNENSENNQEKMNIIKYEERIVKEIPKKIYLVIICLILIIVLQTIKIMKKNDD